MTETNNRIVFNEENIKNIPLAAPGKQISYLATNQKGLALRVGSTSKTFIVYGRVAKGAPTRITLGKHGFITVAQAIKKAKEILPTLASGINLNEEKKKAKIEIAEKAVVQDQTLEWLFNHYRDEQIIKIKGGAASTLKDMKTSVTYFGRKQCQTLKLDGNGKWQKDRIVDLSDWLQRPYRSIKRQEVLDRFEVFEVTMPSRIGNKELNPMIRTHQQAFIFATTAFKFIISRMDEDEELPRNPFAILSAHKKWKHSNVKEGMVDFKSVEFYHFWKAVENYEKHKGVVTDYLLMSLLHAGRSIEIAPLQWKQIDFVKNLITFRVTKNKQDFFFPMTKKVREILERRWEANTDNHFVFEYPTSKYGHITPSCKHVFKNIHKVSGKLISHHDLRRTWATAARHLKMDERTLDYCLKHTIKDVNSHYFVRNEDEIREALQMVEDFFYAQLSLFETVEKIKSPQKKKLPGL